MDTEPQRPRDELHAKNVESSLKELQRHVREHEEELRKLRSAAASQPSPPPSSSAAIMQAAFDSLASAEPVLPFAHSVLPALLALRRTHQMIAESQAFLASQTASADVAKRQLDANRAELSDQQALGVELERRIVHLKAELADRRDKSPAEAAKERAAALEAEREGYDRDRKKLMVVLKGFVSDHLGTMLAAEDLGGPVVGDLMDLDDADLAAGFSSQGKPKKKASAAGGATDDAEDRRQRRLDEIWGLGAGQSPRHETGHETGRETGRETERDRHRHHNSSSEAAAAASELRALLEDLLHALTDSQGNSAEVYVQTARESAAARFLVRVKVAQFHPRDATRLRLVDFTRELDD